MIQFSCPACNTAMQVDDSRAGTAGYCPKCRQPVTVPPALVPASTAAPPVSPRTLPSMPAGGLFGVGLWCAGLLGLGYTVAMNTSVSTGLGPVENIGLLNVRQNWVMVSCTTIIVGVMFHLFSLVRR